MRVAQPAVRPHPADIGPWAAWSGAPPGLARIAHLVRGSAGLEVLPAPHAGLRLEHPRAGFWPTHPSCSFTGRRRSGRVLAAAFTRAVKDTGVRPGDCWKKARPSELAAITGEKVHAATDSGTVRSFPKTLLSPDRDYWRAVAVPGSGSRVSPRATKDSSRSRKDCDGLSRSAATGYAYPISNGRLASER
jgi:hypothetical protein